MTRCPVLLALFLGAGVVATPAFASDPERLLRASRSAEARHTYVGIRVVQEFTPGEEKPRSETVVRVSHRAPDQTRYQFLQGGPRGGLMLQLGESYILRGEDGNFSRVPRNSPPDRLEQLLQNYQLQLAPRREEIAGRRALRIAVQPRHPGNPRKVVWLDAETDLKLRTELYDHQGRLRNTAGFREIEYRARLHPRLFALPKEVRESPVPPAVTPDFEPVLPGHVPPGYALDGTRAWRTRGAIVVHLRYTDGLNTLSLFQSRSRPAVTGRRGRQDGRGRRPDEASPITGRVGSLWYSLEGDLQREHLERMAASLRR